MSDELVQAQIAAAKGGAGLVTQDAVPAEVRAMFDELAENLQKQLRPGGESSVGDYKIRDTDPDEDAMRAEQRAAANNFRFGKALQAHRRGDAKTLEKMGIKAGAEGTGVAGGYLVPEYYITDRFLDVFRPNAILRNLGCTVLEMPSHISRISKLTADVTVNWGAENATLTDAEPTFGQVSWEARKQYAFIIASRELFTDSNPAAEQIFRYSMAKALAVDETKQALIGAANGQNPLGITNYAASTGINTVSLGTNGASPTFDNFTDAIYQLELNNVPPPYGIAWHPRVKQSLRKVKDGYGRYMWDIDLPKAGSPGSIEGYSFDQSTVFPITQTQGTSTDCTTAIIGNWADAWIMERTDMEWLVSDTAGTAMQADQIWIRVTRRMDFGLARPKAFALLTGIRP